MSDKRPIPTDAGSAWSSSARPWRFEPEPELRPQLRDEAVKFLVLRDVETRPEPAVTRASGLIFGRDGHRLGILSDDNEELTFWNVEHNQRLATFSLRAGSGNLPGAWRADRARIA